LSLRHGQQFFAPKKSFVSSHLKERLIPVSVMQATLEMRYRAANGIYHLFRASRVFIFAVVVVKETPITQPENLLEQTHGDRYDNGLHPLDFLVCELSRQVERTRRSTIPSERPTETHHD
jgi:hypothetical protein